MSRFTGCHDHINPDRMDALDDRDTQEGWLFDGPDDRLAEYARYKLPDKLLAQMARAYRHGAPIGWIDEILADSREHFEDDMDTRGQE